jgi:hypothetical protein
VALEAHQQRIEAAETATGKNLGISDLLHAAAAANEQKAEKDKGLKFFFVIYLYIKLYTIFIKTKTIFYRP